ncbi:hypothetical protein FGB62_30g332 [Gracilaria domingensis]|nr:hypothetical protein FGB62_30g332 [Gracilaria domingensis]
MQAGGERGVGKEKRRAKHGASSASRVKRNQAQQPETARRLPAGWDGGGEETSYEGKTGRGGGNAAGGRKEPRADGGGGAGGGQHAVG